MKRAAEANKMQKTFEKYLESIGVYYEPIKLIEEYAKAFNISDQKHLRRCYAKYLIGKSEQWNKIITEYFEKYQQYMWKTPQLKIKSYENHASNSSIADSTGA